MPSHAAKTSDGTRSKVLSLLAVAVVVFAGSAVISLLIVYAGQTARPPLVLILGGSALMTGILVPSVYALVVAPLEREYEQRLKASGMIDANRTAVTDPVTRLANRRGITSSLIEVMAQAERYGDPLSVAMAKIDDFEKMAGTHGRKAAEQALQAVAAVLGETLRMPDRAGRYGEKEFLILLPHTGLKDAGMITERVRKGVASAALSLDGQMLKISVTVGAIQFHKGEDLEQVLTRVEHAPSGKGKSAGRRVGSTKSA
ncbi:MAG: GGDEF domain-containing protein [Acidiferrobacterales bacterium]